MAAVSRMSGDSVRGQPRSIASSILFKSPEGIIWSLRDASCIHEVNFRAPHYFTEQHQHRPEGGQAPCPASKVTVFTAAERRLCTRIAP
jgi:hypothetical protein